MAYVDGGSASRPCRAGWTRSGQPLRRRPERGGFRVHVESAIPEDDRDRLRTVLRYLTRAPVALERLSYDEATAEVRYRTRKPESAAWRENRGRRGGSGCKEGVRRGAERSWKLREHRRGAPDDADGPSHPHLVWVGLQASAAECHGRWRIQVQGIDLTAGQGRACPARHVWAFPLMSRSICRPLRRMAATRPRGPSPGLERPCREGVSTS